jgi:DNA-binding transcriptional regulator YiaG
MSTVLTRFHDIQTIKTPGIFIACFYAFLPLLSSLGLHSKKNAMGKIKREKGSERMRIARNLRMIRELRNFSQQYVASVLHIGRSTLSAWENGMTDLSIEQLMALAVVYRLKDYRQIIDFDPVPLLGPES